MHFSSSRSIFCYKKMVAVAPPSKAVWEAKKVKRGRELMGVVCFSLMPR
ncbi:unnamed protein product [Brassica napus]|uniref:(rape) hypothetical protein n=1 Tax=Brassica napus TaxID=3708 RepID=A0A816KEB1_BRANA|nr:unnamed protein product [Brassica napus]